jgi:peptide-methionine (S)-S-oxide reductase
VGYAGGTKADPTYHDLGDHAESIQLDYDPEKLSYADLLKLFWHGHSPSRPPWSRQYMSAILYHDDEQRRLAESTRDTHAQRLGREIHTEIAPLHRFYRAEDYHQKYSLRRRAELFGELRAYYPRDLDLVDSTVAARINGYVAGCGELADLEAEVDEYGLSFRGRERLLAVARGDRRMR